MIYFHLWLSIVYCQPYYIWHSSSSPEWEGKCWWLQGRYSGHIDWSQDRKGVNAKYLVQSFSGITSFFQSYQQNILWLQRTVNCFLIFIFSFLCGLQTHIVSHMTNMTYLDIINIDSVCQWNIFQGIETMKLNWNLNWKFVFKNILKEEIQLRHTEDTYCRVRKYSVDILCNFSKTFCTETSKDLISRHFWPVAIFDLSPFLIQDFSEYFLFSRTMNNETWLTFIMSVGSDYAEVKPWVIWDDKNNLSSCIDKLLRTEQSSNLR